MLLPRYPHPRPEITASILERSLNLCPELIPPEKREQLQKEQREPTVEDIKPLIIEEGCGLRPSRKNGIRLEKEIRSNTNGDKKVAIVHNYG